VSQAEDPHARSSRASHTEMTELVLPQHSNVLGTAFGGTVLAWMDVCGAICAQRHSGRVSVTAAIDDVNFVSPIRVGDVVILTSRVNAAFGSSVEVEVQVQVEDRATGHRTACVDAFMTFVAVGDDRKPTKQPPLRLETADDERREREARGRRAARLERRKT
jgi:acyl-CoA hydrolase